MKNYHVDGRGSGLSTGMMVVIAAFAVVVLIAMWGPWRLKVHSEKPPPQTTAGSVSHSPAAPDVHGRPTSSDVGYCGVFVSQQIDGVGRLRGSSQEDRESRRSMTASRSAV